MCDAEIAIWLVEVFIQVVFYGVKIAWSLLMTVIYLVRKICEKAKRSEE